MMVRYAAKEGGRGACTSAEG